ncbi:MULTISPECIES: hypothetical protein [Micrococcus]|uniref:hypothetical protein n=1 Tax=Micrococcus TaxID=1269 RepID=UPI0024AFAF3A|nr:hypothetical protein [Micrococcus yunnanensis]WHM16711.1 hypothetical protein QL063_00570 [Micrococcus yunnanensis]
MDVKKYVRRELGLSRRDADLITSRVHTEAHLAHAVLPERWADELHPGPRNARPLREVTPEERDLFTVAQHEQYQRATTARRRRAALAYVHAHNARKAGAAA